MNAIIEARDILHATVGGPDKEYNQSVLKTVRLIDRMLLRNGFQSQYQMISTETPKMNNKLLNLG